MHPRKDLELLAPAGTLPAFETAVTNGADAVYIGAPAFNARDLAPHFTPAEVAGMADYGHRHGVKVYAAMNSLITQADFPAALETLALFSEIGIDAVIIQDLGLAFLAKKHFPTLRLHASTLMAAHNSMAVRQLASMGFARIVLARELPISELRAIREKSSVELEVFVHGALCFGISGLCLLSSFLGGKSGLRGRCVQPCRRRYTWAGRGKDAPAGYLLSMNDLCAIGLLPELRAAGISSLKIEGRMRSEAYVAAVVAGYRLAIDAAPGDDQALTAARERVASAMGRKLSTGFFCGTQGLISPHHSGNTGLFLGKIKRATAGRISLTIQQDLALGDRLRIHHEGSGERDGFTIKELWVNEVKTDQARGGQEATIAAPEAAAAGDSVYRVDTRERRTRTTRIRPASSKLITQLTAKMRQKRTAIEQAEAVPAGQPKPTARPTAISWWLKVDGDRKRIMNCLALRPSGLIVVLSRPALEWLRNSRSKPGKLPVMVALPPVIFENDLAFYERAIATLVRSGYRLWQVANIGQIPLFSPRRVPTLAGASPRCGPCPRWASRQTPLQPGPCTRRRRR